MYLMSSKIKLLYMLAEDFKMLSTTNIVVTIRTHAGIASNIDARSKML